MMLKKFLKGMACLGAALVVGVISKCHAEKIFIKISDIPQEIKSDMMARRRAALGSLECLAIGGPEDYCTIEVFLGEKSSSGEFMGKKIMKSVIEKDCFECDARNNGIRYLGEDTRFSGITGWSTEFTVPDEKYSTAIDAIKNFPSTDNRNCYYKCGLKGARPVADENENMGSRWEALLSLAGVHIFY